MLRFTHWLIVAAYLIAPIIALAAIVIRRRPATFARAFVTCSIAILFGSAIAMSCAFASHAFVSTKQIALCIYLTVSLIVLLGAIDRLLGFILHWTIARRGSSDSRFPKPETRSENRPRLSRKLIETIPFLIRATVLIALAMPYLMALALTYRPKVLPHDNPASALGLNYQPVQFQTSDGFTISGWWIATGEGRRASTPARLQHHVGRDTVIICPGIGAEKSDTLNFIRWLVPAGYNVLVFDFRAHGESDGQLTSLGDLERADVLAAVRWSRENHPEQSERILGVGISTGGAALIEAAADASRDGQAIDAVAVVEGFDDLPRVARTVARQRFLPPLSWVADRVSLALASVQVGADLTQFAPARDIPRIWPRPILIIHGSEDALVPFDAGQRLFNAAQEPKRCLWLPGADYNQTIHSRSTARELLEFFDEAQSVPAA